MRRLLPLLTLVCCAALVAPAAAAPPFPDLIRLPDGWQPEGIASRGTTLYVGSLAVDPAGLGGAVWRGDARTGVGAPLVKPQAGRSAVGLKVRHGRLFVAGGMTGMAFVYDARTGANVADFQLAPVGVGSFINDVIVTRRAAYFTDSFNQQLYVLPFGPRGALGPPQTLPLTGDIQFVPGEFNANGIVAAGHGQATRLIVVQSNTGKLFTVDPRTGMSDEIDLRGETLTNGDGLLLRGRTLYVVRNQLNLVAVVKLARDLSSGTVVAELTDPRFDVPTTITAIGPWLYLPNARFGIADPQTARYDIVRIDRADDDGDDDHGGRDDDAPGRGAKRGH